MAQQRHSGDDIHEQGGKALKRRGILAAAGAVVAGLAAKQMAEPVAAMAPMQFANSTVTVPNAIAGETDMTGGIPDTQFGLKVDTSASANMTNTGGVLGVGAGNGAGLMGLMGV